MPWRAGDVTFPDVGGQRSEVGGLISDLRLLTSDFRHQTSTSQPAHQADEQRPVGRRRLRGGDRSPAAEVGVVLAQLKQQLPGLHLADAGDQREDSHAGDDVFGVFRQPQKAERVLHMGRLDELESAVLVERDVPPGEFDFQVHAMMRRPKQHGLLLQFEAVLPVFEDAVDEVLGLFVFVLAQHEFAAVPPERGPTRDSFCAVLSQAAMTAFVACRMGCVLR